MRIYAVAVVVLALVVGCGSDGPDITGLYAVTSATANGTACGDEMAVPGAAPYFRIKKDSLLGHSFFSVYNCTSTLDTDCTSGGGLFTMSGDDGWHGIVSFASGDTSDCSLGYLDYAALFDPTPTTLQIETHTYNQSGPVSACTTDKAEQLGTSMPCVSSSTLVGTLVP